MNQQPPTTPTGASAPQPGAPPEPLAPGSTVTRRSERISWLAWLYLGLAVLGGLLTWQANVDFIRSHASAFDLGAFVREANANAAARSLSRDLAIGATAVTIWMVSESRRLRLRGLGWVLLSCVTIAFAFGAPLFLHLRERRLKELEAGSADQAPRP